MFDLDKWQEIWHTIKRNKLRTALTMFGVFWGIFMLVILQGSGNGLERGTRQGMEQWASNSGFIWTQKTTKAYDGYQPGRFVSFENDDIEALQQNVEGLDILAPRHRLGGWRGGNTVSYQEKTGTFSVFGDYPDYNKIQSVKIQKGRHINPLDIEQKRKIAVIGESVKNVLFGPEKVAIGKYILINGVNFKVVGLFRSYQTGEQGNRDMQTIYVPFTTFQQAFSVGDKIGWFGFTARPDYEVSKVEKDIKSLLMKRHHVHPEDFNALGSVNLQEEFRKFNGLFNGINIFTWVVSIGTLLAGIIGVSNIMLIIVKERTREIGIRKSIGAKPWSIISLILQESVFLTLVAGYLGLFVAVLLLNGISNAMPENDGQAGIINPGIDLSTGFIALLILVFFGAIAGLLPAKKAAGIRPIEALRAE